MKLGLLTNSLIHVGWDLGQIAKWANANGIKYLEVGPTAPLELGLFENVQSQYDVEIKALIYCRNFLAENEEEAKMHQDALKARIKTAGQLDNDVLVVASTGRPKGADTKLTKGLKAVVRFLEEMLELAELHNVKLAVENCPMMGNIAVSPYMYELLFSEIQNPLLGWAYDPSHLVFQFCDIYNPIIDYKERIYHVHAKDTLIDYSALAKMGTLAGQDWWRYCLPGKGAVDWRKIMANLKQSDYRGIVSIEHEDRCWSNTPEQITQGILLAKEHLEHSLK
ncbi:MAG: sugar phosphate isomerase/epimerase [Firmicutes bacterium]|nr:sugar phosphate isomerase/epimerase [Bacillota bacterium]